VVTTQLPDADFYFAPTTVTVGQNTTVRGWLKDTTGNGIGGKTIKLQYLAGGIWADTGSFGTTETVAPNIGYTSFGFAPGLVFIGTKDYRLRFEGDAGYTASQSGSKNLTVTESTPACDSVCASNGYDFAKCSGGEGDACISNRANDWWYSGGANGCTGIYHCWCRKTYNSVFCNNNQVYSGFHWDITNGCSINTGASTASKGTCGVGAAYGPGGQYAQCNDGRCDTNDASTHNGEICVLAKNCNTEWQNSPTISIDSGPTFTWMLSTTISGSWDATNKQCVKCGGKIKTDKYGDTAGFYASCYGTILPSGDIPDKCESACGAISTCDEKFPNERLGVAPYDLKKCKNDCSAEVCDLNKSGSGILDYFDCDLYGRHDLRSGDLTIANGKTLRMNPGSELYLDKGYKINLQNTGSGKGKIEMIGTGGYIFIAH